MRDTLDQGWREAERRSRQRFMELMALVLVKQGKKVKVAYRTEEEARRGFARAKRDLARLTEEFPLVN